MTAVTYSHAEGRAALLSSPWTPLAKAWPLLLLAVLALITGYGWIAHDEERYVGGALGLVILGPVCVVWAFLNRRIADAVKIIDAQIHVRRRRVEQRVDLSDVLNVSAGSPWRTPMMASIRFRSSGPLGDEVHFMPFQSSTSFWSLGRRLNAIETLIHAVDSAKLGSSR